MAREKEPEYIKVMRKQIEWALDRHAHKVIELTAIRGVEKRMREFCVKKLTALNEALVKAGLPAEEFTAPIDKN